ncbi:MAG: DNA polymerase I [Candidatus Cardinium sp.]|uniref:DNA polymerase I n=1 Tax=Candidatus Cardinium sp. TP TaxID=2961955 RepID=UPI0021AFDAFA|nr:DNA polymerase I [Candidatus Cardinium sp. TP]MCT4696970.1 DNA polymerase I [Candidatus Cardinium sp. TP]MDN5247015.1 DNA polymerase I [Candidatus Cardinium sp.]
MATIIEGHNWLPAHKLNDKAYIDQMIPKKLFLLDGMSLIYRAYFALGKAVTVTRQGIQTGAILGFVNTLVEVLQKEKPTHLIVAFDDKAKTFRHELFPAYKSHRPAQPEEISIAIPYIQAILDGFGILSVTCSGYEADDLLGTLAKKAVGATTYIVSTDKDLAQVVTDGIYLYKPNSHGQKATILGKKEILAEWEIVRPEQVRDILALAGDPSDFIPGIPSIGKKTARKLIKAFDHLENVLAHSHTLKGRLKANLIEYADQGLLSKQLATICTDVPIALDWEACRYQGPNRTKLESLFTSLEFKQLQQRLFGGATADLFQTTERVAATLTQPDCATLMQKLQHIAVWAFDIATTHIDPHRADLLGIAFSYQTGQIDYLMIPTDPAAAEPLLALLQPLFNRRDICKVGHNIKDALIVLQRYGLHVAPPLFDTMIAHALVAPDGRHTFAALSEQYLDYTPNDRETVAPEAHKGYLNEQAALTLQVYPKLVQALMDEAMERLFYEVEMPLVPVLAAIEIEGVAIDLTLLKQLGEEMERTTHDLKEKIYTLAETNFNIDSPKQLGKVLFEKLKLHEKPIQTKGGQYATGESVLAKLTKVHPIVPIIMEHRAWQKLRSTYVDALPTMVHPIDQRLHAAYHQTVATTGRLSATGPNLQNIPIKATIGLRKAFIPHRQGDCLFSADYSQIELRIMAAYAQDATMISAFQADKDIHQITARKLFKTEEVDQEMRRKAKIANFGIIYGISAFGLAERMGNVSRKEAAELIAAYFEEFPGIKNHMEHAIAQAKQKGYATTLLGRKRWLPDIHARNSALRSFAERNAINTPIQGSAAEMIKLAMIQIHHWLTSHKLKSKLIIQVHDELVFNVPTEEVAEIQHHIPLLMAQALPLANVPIKVNGHIGANWLEAHG